MTHVQLENRRWKFGVICEQRDHISPHLSRDFNEARSSGMHGKHEGRGCPSYLRGFHSGMPPWASCAAYNSWNGRVGDISEDSLTIIGRVAFHHAS